MSDTVIINTSKSFADILLSLLENWGKFCRFLLLLGLSGLWLALTVYGVLRALPRNTGQLNLASGSIIFSQPTQDGNEYLVVISPQGWQETGIAVREGDHMRFDANGRVNIDLAGLNAALAVRHNADQRILSDEKQAGQWEAEKEDFAPEDHYTPEELRKMRPTWRWTDPNGIAETAQFALPSRLKRCLLPGRGYGALLGAIRETGVQPTAGDAFFVGAKNDIVAKQSGKLYFAVNDVQSRDKTSPDLFFADNIGFFYAKVTVNR
jgi:hypothetical protein